MDFVCISFAFPFTWVVAKCLSLLFHTAACTTAELPDANRAHSVSFFCCAVLATFSVVLCNSVIKKRKEKRCFLRAEESAENHNIKSSLKKELQHIFPEQRESLTAPCFVIAFQHILLFMLSLTFIINNYALAA